MHYKGGDYMTFKGFLKKCYDYFKNFLILFLLGAYFIVPTGTIASQYVENPESYQKISIENYLNYSFKPFGSSGISFDHARERLDYSFFRLSFYGVEKLSTFDLSKDTTLILTDKSFVDKSSPVVIFVNEAKKTFQTLDLSKGKELSLPSGHYSVFVGGHCYWLSLAIKDKSIVPYISPTGFEKAYEKKVSTSKS